MASSQNTRFIMTQIFHEVFSALRTIMEKFTPPLTVTNDNPTRYDMVSEKEVMQAGKKRNRVNFATLLIQKNYVTLYFYPVYTHPYKFKNMPGEIKKTLKGKSCFVFKELDAVLQKQVQQLMKQGFDLYKKEKRI